jgi:pimeloyl-ACP methyl ester carboxylesterase
MSNRHDTLTLDGGRKQVVVRTGDGPPLVWLHGLNGIEVDDPVVAALSANHSVLAPLAPGFEDLDELGDIRDIHDLALHYDDVLEAAGLDAVPLVGHSFGAMIAAEIAAHFPRRASQLVLLAPLGLWNDEYPVADLFAIPAAEMPSLLYANQDLAKQAVTPDPRGDVEQLIKLVRGMTTVARFLWPIPDRGLARRLHRVRAPTLIVHGERDVFVPAQYAHDFAEQLPQAEARIVDDAGHMLTVEAPDKVISAIEHFLTQRVNGREAVA